MEGKRSRRGLTEHTFGLLLRLRQILLDQLQIKLELDMLVLQLGITSRQVAGFLRRTNRQNVKDNSLPSG